MKITTKNYIYIQKRDLVLLKDIYRILPENIINKVFNEYPSNIYDYNEFDFIKFTDTDIINYFEYLDCISEYKELQTLTKQELVELGISWSKAYDSTARTLYSLEKDDPNYENILYQYKTLEFKVLSFRHIIDFFNGLIDMPLPFPFNQKFKTKQLINKIIPTKN